MNSDQNQFEIFLQCLDNLHSENPELNSDANQQIDSFFNFSPPLLLAFCSQVINHRDQYDVLKIIMSLNCVRRIISSFIKAAPNIIQAQWKGQDNFQSRNDIKEALLTCLTDSDIRVRNSASNNVAILMKIEGSDWNIIPELVQRFLNSTSDILKSSVISIFNEALNSHLLYSWQSITEIPQQIIFFVSALISYFGIPHQVTTENKDFIENLLFNISECIHNILIQYPFIFRDSLLLTSDPEIIAQYEGRTPILYPPNYQIGQEVLIHIQKSYDLSNKLIEVLPNVLSAPFSKF